MRTRELTPEEIAKPYSKYFFLDMAHRRKTSWRSPLVNQWTRPRQCLWNAGLKS